ncbi:zinc finger protein 2-like [Armigeres subalbatus]|uniref:zinc finger protein 2-like n=1 Tax=Armigeres subalbatus TaxID=124917 RepID=UPI002ED0137E
MSSCLTCTKSATSHGSISIASSRAAQNAVAKHLWFKEDESSNGILCRTCWTKIDEFHQFYCEIESIHSNKRADSMQLVKVKQEEEIKREKEVMQEVEVKKEEEVIEIATVEIQHGDDTVHYNVTVFGKVDDDDDENSIGLSVMEVCKETDDRQDIGNKSAGNAASKEPPTFSQEALMELDAYAEKLLHLECSFCSEVYPTFDMLQKHSVKLHRKHSTVVCCKVKYNQHGKFYNHMKSHLSTNQLQLEKPCSSTSTLKRSYIVIDDDLTEYEKIKGNNYSDDYYIKEDDEESDNGQKTKGKCLHKRHCVRAVRAKQAAEEKIQAEKYALMHGALECSYCPKTYTTFDLLQNHSMKTHRRSTSVLCCKKKFSIRENFYEHMENHLNPNTNQFQCNKCDEWFTSTEALKTHVDKKHGPEQVFECGMCPKKFSSKALVTEHRNRCKFWK